MSKDGGDDDAPMDGFMPQPDVSVADGGPVGDAHISIDGALIDDSFEMGGTCDGWSLASGANTYLVAGGHTGKRACLVCGTIYAVITKHVLAPGGGGIYQALAFVRAPE